MNVNDHEAVIEITLSISVMGLGGVFARILPPAVRASNEWGKSWTRHDMQRRAGTELCWLRICFQSTPLISIPTQHLETLLLVVFIQNA